MATGGTPSPAESSCANCDRPNTVDDLVQCDRCKAWWHMSCAGVTHSVEGRAWNCSKCVSSTGSTGSVLSVPSSSRSRSSTKSKRAKLVLQMLQEEQDMRMKQLKEQQDMEKSFLERKYALIQAALEEEEQEDGVSVRSRSSHRSNVRKTQQWVNELGEANEDTAAALPKIADPAPDPQKKGAIPKHSRRLDFTESTPQNICKDKEEVAIEQIGHNDLPESIPMRAQHGEQQVQAAAPPPWPNSFALDLQKEKDASRRQNLRRVEYPETASKWFDVRPSNSGKLDPKPPHPGKSDLQTSTLPTHANDETQLSSIEHLTKQFGLVSVENMNLPDNINAFTPTPSQLAARQVMPRDLPVFSGSPADWPVYISNFMNSTLACGYSPAENLIRLQRSLKGPALEAVRSRLLLPESVPHIIDTLRLLYGRPELLINALIEKVHSVPTPKAEKLESLIDFGMAVQSLSDHLEAANQKAHLSNPSLLIELVDKLPVHMKMEWVKFVENKGEVNLKVFGEFMSGIVKSASQVTLYTGMASRVKKSEVEDKWKQKRVAVHSHQLESPPASSGDGSDKACPACRQKNHRLKDCGVFRSYSIEGRSRFVQQHGICRNCLNAHGRRACRNSGVCGVNACPYRHHQLLHFPRSNVSAVENHVHREIHPSLYFRIIPVTICGGGRSIEIFAFLDDGSQLTLIEEGLVRQLGVEGMELPLCLKWTGNMTRTENGSRAVSLSITTDDKRLFELKEVRTVKSLTLPSQTVDYDYLATKYSHLRGIPMKSYSAAVPRLLLGVDNLRLTVPLKTREGKINEPVAVKTRLGWCIYGGQAQSVTASLNYHYCECSADQALHGLVKEFFAAEDVGTRSPPPIVSEDDRRASELLETTTKRTGSRFETGLLWRFDNFKLPESYGMALKRLECLEKRMEKQPELRANIAKQINEYVAKGYVHRATEEELRFADSKRVWYLPLGVVFNPKKPNKVRLIWDAAAKSHGVSLNDMLLKGPDQLTSLPAVLFRFRQFAIAVSADIAEMFHQIGIVEGDRHAQRFLWREDPFTAPEVFLMNVATFGSTCSPASAQFVKNKNALEFRQQYPRAVQSIVKNHYVDDLLESFETEEEAAKVIQEVRMIHAHGGFNIRNFQSNSPVVLDSVGEKSALNPCSLDLHQAERSERVLGLLWTPHEDMLGFSTIMPDEIQKVISTGVAPTKRQVLKCLMSFYDPLGLLALFTVQGKIILQAIWRSNTQWDQQIGAVIRNRWQQWIQILVDLQHLHFPRCYFDQATLKCYQHVQLHIFVDASEEAYAAVAFFRIVDPQGRVCCSLVAAKTKVAPIKPISIPRLELQAAVLGVRLMQWIVEGHSIRIEKKVFWTDSSTVLSWIKSDKRRYKQFVAVRVGEILTETNVEEWRYVPSKKNIADAATKWGKGPDLNPDGVWFKGPTFLKDIESKWPVSPKLKEDDVEVRPIFVHQAVPVVKLAIDLERFSNWNRVLRTTAYLLRFISKSRKRTVPQSTYLSQEELAAAWRYLICAVQWDSYPDEMVTLTNNLRNPSGQMRALDKTSSLYQLSPMLDDCGMLRVDSRIQAARNVLNDTKLPIILPRKHKLTHLIIESFHRKYLHGSPETVVNEIRQLYYIPKLRTMVRLFTKDCQLCKIKRAQPQIPRMAPLPSARLASFIRPFSYVGLDLFGPLLVKLGRSNAKRWIALFTCLTIRAVHVEVVYSLSTDSCVMSVRRFVSRRGAPVEIHSDNGTNFRGADRLLREQIQNINEAMAETFTNTTTKWVFIPPSAPHMGGSWERMVRSVKVAMEAANGGRRLDDEGLITLAVEAEGIVNSRPLTYLPLDSEEAEALTPNHFILGSSSGVRQPATKPADEVVALRNSWGQIQVQTDVFWKRWTREYLPTLTRRVKWFGEVKPIAVGDLVLVVEETRRNGWTRGRVCEVYKGQDGRIRQAMVQTSGGLIRRPVSKLAILDVAQVGKTGPGTSGDQCYGEEDVLAGSTA